MTYFYFKEKGVQYPAEEYFKANLEKYMDVLTIAKNYLNEKFKENSRPTEINFVRYPYLGDELFNDLRIASEGLDLPKDYYNQLGGVAIYIKGEQDQNKILREAYRELRIGYIHIAEHYGVIENVFGALHELNHFIDPYSSSINYATKIYEKRYQQNTELFIQHNTRHILNEYYANYRAFKFLKSILTLLDLQEFDIKAILESTIYNLENSLEDLINRLNIIKNLEENYTRFNQYLIICFRFFENIFKIFGKWHGLSQDFKEIDNIYIKFYENLRPQLKNGSLEFIIDYLNPIESLINPDFKKKGNLEELYKLFYHLGSRYPDVLNSLE